MDSEYKTSKVKVIDEVVRNERNNNPALDGILREIMEVAGIGLSDRELRTLQEDMKRLQDKIIQWSVDGGLEGTLNLELKSSLNRERDLYTRTLTAWTLTEIRPEASIEIHNNYGVHVLPWRYNIQNAASILQKFISVREASAAYMQRA